MHSTVTDSTIISTETYILDGKKLNSEQIEAYEKISSNKNNFFVTGKAGTGKSLLLKYCVENIKKKKNVVVLAPTGIAAINIAGQTIHSFFGLQTGLQNITDVSVSSKQKSLFQAIEVIIIDEISMVRCDIMDMIDAKLKIARENDLPFGGCQIIVFGDLYQLPPVLGKDENEKKYILDCYGSEFFFAAPAVQEYPFTIIELSEVHRQKDSQLIENLNNVRIGLNDS